MFHCSDEQSLIFVLAWVVDAFCPGKDENANSQETFDVRRRQLANLTFDKSAPQLLEALCKKK